MPQHRLLSLYETAGSATMLARRIVDIHVARKLRLAAAQMESEGFSGLTGDRHRARRREVNEHSIRGIPG